MKSICKTFSVMGVTFRDESNKSSSTIIGYSDATITASNHPLIIRSNILSAITHATVHNYGVYFIIKYYLISLISGQRRKSFYKKKFTSNQTRPRPSSRHANSSCAQRVPLFATQKAGSRSRDRGRSLTAQRTQRPWP